MEVLFCAVVALCAAAVGGCADSRQNDALSKVASVRLVGVASIRDGEDVADESRYQPAATRIVVEPGANAYFLLDYEVADGVKSRIWTSPNCSEHGVGGNFGTGGSALHEGRGRAIGVIHLEDEDFDRPVLLRSVRFTVRAETEDGCRDLGSEYAGDAAVNVVFSKGRPFVESDLDVLDPLPSPTAEEVVEKKKAAAAALAAVRPGASVPAGFTDNLDEALARARASGRYVFACFSGSDWCGWCRKLEQEVLSRPEFVSGVSDDYELVFIDSPINKGLLSERAAEENPALVEKYGIQGFPTALVLDGSGAVVGRTGYRQGGPAAYVEHLKGFRISGRTHGAGRR